MAIIRVAIPAMDELDYLPVTLNALASQQTNYPFEVYICVNQPESYWDNPEKLPICEHNRQLLEYLHNYAFLTLHILDRSSRGNGWPAKKFGVGYARKELFTRILAESDPDDVIVSLDADTQIQPRYLQTVAEQFSTDPSLNALAVPYYHPLVSDDEIQCRAMLRYEIYMRNYAINLLKINSPYGFTALGSAIVMRARALAKIGNITPFQSGEDFYLVQKFCKMGGLRLFNTECVYPASRFSDRVPFGTGPAMRMGSKGVWDSYPIYHHDVFNPIKEAYDHLEDLYVGNISGLDNEFLSFLQKEPDNKDIWKDIRRNVSDFPHFVKAFHQKADGLRILQFVRTKHLHNPIKQELALTENMHAWMFEKCPEWHRSLWDFQQCSIQQLDLLRGILFEEEQILREKYA